MMGHKGYAFTAIPEWGLCPEGELQQYNMLTFCTRFRRSFIRSAPKSRLLACVDISRNDHTGVGGGIHYQIHFHGIILGLRKGYLEQLRAEFKWTSDGCARPVVIKPLTDIPGQLAYMAKPNFVRRISYNDGKRNTRIEKMPIAKEAELSKWLNQYRAEQRVIRIGEIMT